MTGASSFDPEERERSGVKREKDGAKGEYKKKGIYACERRETISCLTRVEVDLKHGFALKLHAGVTPFTPGMFKMKH